MNRCLLVATDGSPAAHAALFYALEFASALRADEIACLCVHEETQSVESASAAVTAGEMALATGTPGPILLEVRERPSRLPIQPDAVLDVCREEVTAAGLRFTPVIGSTLPSRVIASSAHMGELIFLGRNSDRTFAASSHLGATVSTVLQSVHQTVVVCPATYAPVDRIVLMMAGDLGDAELVARGATWAEALHVPALVAVPGTNEPVCRNALEAAERVVANSGVEATGTMYACRPEQFARQLAASDLILVARRQPWDLVHLWFGNATDRIIEHSAGPAAVMPRT